MKPLSRLALLSAFLLAAAPVTHGATFISVLLEGMLDSSNVLLPAGSRYEVGTFSGDTASFTGDWNVLGVGNIDEPGQTNPLAGVLTGPLAETVTFGSDYVGPFAIRVYDTFDDTGRYNTVTSGAFNTTPPTPTEFSARPSSSGLVWQAADSAFKTAIPEPSTGLLGLLGLTLLLRRRR